ncbi:MAG: hypothetical protein GF419_09655 [Ignavibacteriales bacterium]|nr:hypothetical protein [Ignavibacteriales bacterium]
MKRTTRLYLFASLLAALVFACDDSTSADDDGEQNAKPVSWEFTQPNTSQDNTHTFAIPYAVSPTIDGAAIAEGDLVGVFYATPDRYVCAGYVEWERDTAAAAVALTVWGKGSGADYGLIDDDPLVWKAKRASDGKTFDATVAYAEGPSVFKAGGISALAGFTAK